MFIFSRRLLAVLSLCLLVSACGAKPETTDSSSNQPVQTSTSSTAPSASSSPQGKQTSASSSMSPRQESRPSSSSVSKPQASSSATATETATSSSSVEDLVEAQGQTAFDTVPLGQLVQGTWEHHGDFSQATLTFAADGTVSNQITYSDASGEGVFRQEHFNHLIKISDNLYRVPEGDGGLALIPVTGLGGAGKSIIGLYLAPDGTIYPQSWGMSPETDVDSFDYANNVQTSWPLTKVP